MTAERNILVVEGAAAPARIAELLLGSAWGGPAVGPAVGQPLEVFGERFRVFQAGDVDVAEELVRHLEAAERRLSVAVIDLTDGGDGEDEGAVDLEPLDRLRAVDPELPCLAVLSSARSGGAALFASAPGDWDRIEVPFSGDALRRRARLLARSRGLQILQEQAQPLQDLLVNQGLLAALGELTAGLSHELNNPVGFVKSNLTSLEGYIDKIKRYAARVMDGEQVFARGDPAAAATFFQDLHQLRRELKLDFVLDDIGQLVQQSQRGITRLQKGLNDLRAFSPVEDPPGQIDLNETVEGVLTLLNNEFKYKAAAELDCGSLPLIQCSKAALGRVVLFVLLNAVRAVRKGGAIRIETLRSGEEGVRLEISDDGRPLSPRCLASALSTQHEVSGPERTRALRLHLAYLVIRQLGGVISAESGQEGTTVTIDLPASCTPG
jgi:signal transduction histidine kinase